MTTMTDQAAAAWGALIAQAARGDEAAMSAIEAAGGETIISKYQQWQRAAARREVAAAEAAKQAELRGGSRILEALAGRGPA